MLLPTSALLLCHSGSTKILCAEDLGFRVRHLLCRETALLIDPASASIQDYRYVSNVIAHEMTHQVGAFPGWPCCQFPKGFTREAPLMIGLRSALVPSAAACSPGRGRAWHVMHVKPLFYH